jgi:ankyrin repeat protein
MNLLKRLFGAKQQPSPPTPPPAFRKAGAAIAPSQVKTFQLAVSKPDLDQVKMLLKDNPNLISSKDNQGWTPLHTAAAYGHKEIVELLLASNAEVNAKDNGGGTPLCFAASNGKKEVAELLLAKGAEVNSKSNRHSTPLHTAAFNDHEDIAKLLLANGAEVNAKDDDGNTPLHDAASGGQATATPSPSPRGKSVAALLLANKSEVNAKNIEGRTPLDHAAFWGLKDVAEFLLANGADVKSTNKEGVTALHAAAMNGHGDVVELLVDCNADVNAKSAEGVTPFHLAKGRGFTDVAEMLNVEAVLQAKLRQSQVKGPSTAYIPTKGSSPPNVDEYPQAVIEKFRTYEDANSDRRKAIEDSLDAESFSTLKAVMLDENIHHSLRKRAIVLATKQATAIPNALGGRSAYVAFIAKHFIAGKNPSKLHEAYQNGDYRAGITNGLLREAIGCLEEEMGLQFEVV